MKTLLPFVLVGLLAVNARAIEPGDQLPPQPEGKTWKLVWHDEFDGTKLDESKWDVPDNRRRDGWWSPKAVSVDKGHLATSWRQLHHLSGEHSWSPAGIIPKVVLA